MATKEMSIGGWIRRSLKEDAPRSKSLIVTIFGDSLSPVVPGVWLSELIELLCPFGVNEQLVRTSCFRLAEEGWLESQRKGRRSRYSLTRSGQQRVEHAYHRIYDPPPQEWDGNWTIVILSKTGNPVAERAELRREMEWEGFGPLAAGIFVNPHANITTLNEVLNRLGLAQHVVVLQARNLDAISSRSITTLAAECWNLDMVAAHYIRFLKLFRPVLPLLQDVVDPQAAFVVQTLLIHSFRRVVLHDPRLPAALLPKTWPGHEAYDLCRGVYLRTFQEVHHYLVKLLEEADSHPFERQPDFLNRLGGLEP
jgi:phenylacetic acid degradation operon negative regulatory protein